MRMPDVVDDGPAVEVADVGVDGGQDDVEAVGFVPVDVAMVTGFG